MALRKLIVFGVGDIAQLAHFYFTHDSDYTVVAFTVDRAYIVTPELFGLPVVPFDRLSETFSPGDHHMFVAMGYSGVNANRRAKYEACKAQGYAMATYVHHRATTFPGFTPGENCFILEDNTIQPFAVIGHNVTLWSGNHIGHHSVIGHHVFMASHVVVSGGVVLGEQCFVGVNATLRDHITIGDRCVIGAGATLMADAEADGVYPGPVATRSRIPSSRLRRM